MVTNCISDYFFDTVTIKTNEKTNSIYEAALKEKINLRKVDKNTLSVAFDEAKKLDDVNTIIKNIWKLKTIKQDDKVELTNLPKNLLRTSKYLNSSYF